MELKFNRHKSRLEVWEVKEMSEINFEGIMAVKKILKKIKNTN